MITKTEIDKLAAQYETGDFIKDDPVQFPHRFSSKKILSLQVLLHPYLLMAAENSLSKN